VTERADAARFDRGLERNAANYVPLSPVAFLERSERVYPDKIAVVHGRTAYTYRDFGARCRRFASSLSRLGVARGDTVAIIAPNIPALLEAHYAVPAIGAVLNPLNVRLDAATIAVCLDHGRARVLLVDAEYAPAVRDALARCAHPPMVVDLDDAEGPGHGDIAARVGTQTYEALLAQGDPAFALSGPADEWDAISLLYTSGTTGNPKGVVYHHRGAYLNALGNALAFRLGPDSVYLWTLPMFHCNGWCTPWAVTAIGATHVCLRAVRADVIWKLLDEERVTHLDGAPTVLTLIANAPEAHQLGCELVATVAGAPPGPTVITRMRELGARIVHVYGMTEVYGPYTLNEWQPGWSTLPPADQARRQARQGVSMIQADPIRVVDERMNDVPRDGRTMGEIVMRGNNVMVGYFRDEEATEKAFRGGWLHSGDLGVQHSDGYVELRDRAKDIIISGGENISTIEIEHAVEAHAAVLEVAVIGVPDEKWGERPKAFVVRKAGAEVAEAEIVAYVRERIARYKVPRAVEFVASLPRTSTGKVQKFDLREKEWAGHASRIQG